MTFSCASYDPLSPPFLWPARIPASLAIRLAQAIGTAEPTTSP